MGEWIVAGGFALAVMSVFGILALREVRNYARWKRNFDARTRYLESLVPEKKPEKGEVV